jgi:hypothetical protein
MDFSWPLAAIDTDTGNDHSFEQRLYYNADVGWPSCERQNEVNGEYILVAT